ncbi:MAG: YggS family pyridoxal phosphate-dependent enzyme [Proteobacteria bacterium]|nr:YggS family pyridoxal phosphate-dependent enzyme [Pseudomonadota bacterium]
MTSNLNSEISRNLFLVNSKIEKACQLYKKDKSKVNLIAVSKTQTVEKIKEAIKLGCKNFGENYIKEAVEKWSKIRQENPEIKLHLIGHLQSNKAEEAIELFDIIQTLDSEKLALIFQKEIIKQKKNPEFFIQVNIGEEQQKGGIAPDAVKKFTEFSRDKCGLNVTGLMCIPPNSESASPYFALLAKLAKENNLKNLSMGMSSDFEEAIALDANYIRIGTAIFGERK